MDRSSRLADLKLVSKYYPVANYSYPRRDTLAPYGHARGSSGRSSLGSEGSAPGLIDDRTDSEVSVDDDYQYHAHASELWDTFWQPGLQGKQDEPHVHPRKQYPALIPSPEQRGWHQQGEPERMSPAWPLPESPSAKRQRQPAATYSPFPKPSFPPPRSTSRAPCWTSSRPGSKPPRPPRPDSSLIPPCLKQTSPTFGQFATTPAKPQRSSQPRPLTPLNHRPMTPLEPRPSTALGTRPSAPWDARPTIYSLGATSSTDIPMFDAPDYSGPSSSASSDFPQLTPSEPEPQSFFEESDSETESEEPCRSFFRFHKHSNSDIRRSAKAAELAVQRRRRARASTAPSPARQQPDRSCKTPTPGRKRAGGDVLGRMLGRRSR